jgi:hypothetical protein
MDTLKKKEDRSSQLMTPSPNRHGLGRSDGRLLETYPIATAERNNKTIMDTTPTKVFSMEPYPIRLQSDRNTGGECHKEGAVAQIPTYTYETSGSVPVSKDRIKGPGPSS